MANANIRQVTEINPNGKYVIQFPEGTSEEVRKQMDEVLELARKENKNVYLEPGVKVIDLETASRAEVIQPTPAPVETPIVEAPAPEPVVQPQPVQQPQAPQPGYVIDPNAVIMAQQPFQTAGAYYQYNPLPQPRYVAPVPQGQAVPAPMYHPGVAPQYAWAPQPQFYQVPAQPVYNPQLAEGPVGQQAARVAQPVPAAPVRPANATIEHQPYTLPQQPQQ